jgi:hypothetical protein
MAFTFTGGQATAANPQKGPLIRRKAEDCSAFLLPEQHSVRDVSQISIKLGCGHTRSFVPVLIVLILAIDVVNDSFHISETFLLVGKRNRHDKMVSKEQDNKRSKSVDLLLVKIKKLSLTPFTKKAE